MAHNLENQTELNIPTSNIKMVRWGSAAFIAMPFCYLGMFLIFGVFLDIPQSGNIGDKIFYIADQHALVSAGYTIGYLVFGGLLLIAVLASHWRRNNKMSHLLNISSVFGLIWVVLMMCSGMIALVGLNTMVELSQANSLHSETVFYVYTTVVNGMGGGVELVGGLWVLLLSIHGIKNKSSYQLLDRFGVVVGILGIATILQSIPNVKDAFGLSQIIWFVWMGINLLRFQEN